MNFNYEQSIWGRGAADLRWSSPTSFRLHQALLALEKLSTGAKVLEIGCGGGQFIRAIKRFRPELSCFGCDISSTAIAEARMANDSVGRDCYQMASIVIPAKAGIHGDEVADSRFRGNDKLATAIEYTESEQSRLPYGDNSFDAVLIFDVLEHAEDPEGLLVEVRRVLSKDGVFYCFIPCEGDWLSLWYWLDRIGLKKDLTRKYAGHINYFSRRGLLDIFKKSGFDVKCKRYSEHLFGQILGTATFFLMDKKSGGRQINNEEFFAELNKKTGSVGKLLKNIINSEIFLESYIFSRIPSPNIHIYAKRSKK